MLIYYYIFYCLSRWYLVPYSVEGLNQRQTIFIPMYALLYFYSIFFKNIVLDYFKTDPQ